jgi:5,5'-dehydrodivanillate O-demethylase
MRVGGGGVHQMQIRVPVNRTTTRFILYTARSPDGYEHVEQPQIPDHRIPVFDARGRHVTNYVEGQDIIGLDHPGPDHLPSGGEGVVGHEPQH